MMGTPAAIRKAQTPFSVVLSADTHLNTTPPPPSAKRSAGTMKYQSTLPKMPIPPLNDTLDRYLECVLPLLCDESARNRTQAAVQHFRENDGAVLYQKLLNYNEEHVNYIEHFYRELFTGTNCSHYSLNPNFVLFPHDGCDTAAKRAAHLTWSSMQLFLDIKEGTFPPMMTKKGPLCMRQIPWVFASTRQARKGTDHMVSFLDSSRHIVALCRGAAYKVTVLSKGGQLLTTREMLESAFNEIIANASTLTKPETDAVGALTTGERATWAAARSRLEEIPHNEQALADMDQAILTIAIDDVAGLTNEEMELNMLYGLPTSVHNRWMDKFNIIVCADGQAGLNWEHSMLDGHTMMEFMAPVAAGYQRSEDEQSSSVARRATVDVQPLSLKVDPQTKKEISAAVQHSLELSSKVGVETLEFSTFGANFIKKARCSPDGFAQTAMMLTFYELRGRLPRVYESVLAKAYLHGRVTVARSMSPKIAESMRSFFAQESTSGAAATSRSVSHQIEHIRTVASEVTRICLEAASAHDWDRPLLALRRLAPDDTDPLEDYPIFADAAWAMVNEADLCTSHCGRHPIKFCGYEPAGPQCFSIGYAVEHNHIHFSITHFEKKAAREYKEALDNMLQRMEQLFRADAKITTSQ